MDKIKKCSPATSKVFKQRHLNSLGILTNAFVVLFFLPKSEYNFLEKCHIGFPQTLWIIVSSSQTITISSKWKHFCQEISCLQSNRNFLPIGVVSKDLPPCWLVQSNCKAKVEVTLMAPMSVQVSTSYGRPMTFPWCPDMRIKLVRTCTRLSVISEGKVTAHAATNSDIRSPSRSGSFRGNEIFTKGMW